MMASQYFPVHTKRTTVIKKRSRMKLPPRTAAFILTSSNRGAMIVSRFDYAVSPDGYPYGVGYQLLESGAYEDREVDDLLYFLLQRRAHFGDGVIGLDCGANIGVHTVEWAKLMSGWGHVIAIEAQERIFYALAGNIALNNCLNARAIHAAISDKNGSLKVPCPDYLQPANLGGLELKLTKTTEFIGQEIDYSDEGTMAIRMLTIDSLTLPRLDLLKTDIEGMELEAIDGGRETILAHRPVIVAEHIKVGWAKIKKRLTSLGYTVFQTPMNIIAVHKGDPICALLKPERPKRSRKIPKD
jgi:FkbM family methyltransferase